jgi:hypothetical protein
MGMEPVDSGVCPLIRHEKNAAMDKMFLQLSMAYGRVPKRKHALRRRGQRATT